jgi:FMN reductase
MTYLNGANRPLRLVAVSGNPRPQSRTHALAVTLTTELARARPAVGHLCGQTSTVSEIELAGLGSRVLEPDDAAAQAAVTQVLEADILVISSPTYKASYSGLLKSFLDRIGHQGLTGKSAVPIMLGGLPSHQLAVNLHFAPLLLELGAKVPAGGLFVLESEVGDYPAFAADWADANVATLVAATGVASSATAR